MTITSPLAALRQAASRLHRFGRQHPAAGLVALGVLIAAAGLLGYIIGDANHDATAISQTAALKQQRTASSAVTQPAAGPAPSGSSLRERSSGTARLAGTVKLVTADGFVLATSGGNQLLVLTDIKQTHYQQSSITPGGTKPSSRLQPGQQVRVQCTVQPGGQFLATVITITAQ